MEKILSITESTFQRSKEDWHWYDGYEVVTDKQSIRFGISNSQQCCENWGYLMTNDDTKEFIGADLLEIKVVDEALNGKKIAELDYEAAAMFVNFETSNGTLQFVAYNSHNGYYSHSAVLISREVNAEETL